jgi:HK97 gp10 family phage protein
MADLTIDTAAVSALMGGAEVHSFLERCAIKVESMAKQLCPVDTGRLRASIDHVTTTDGQGPVAFVGSNVEYALYVELGTRYMAAEPYLRPALRAVAS